MTKKKDRNAAKKTGEKHKFGWVIDLAMPALAVFTGLLVGAIIIAVSNDTALAAWRNFFHSPGDAFKATWNAVAAAYGSLFAGAFGSPKKFFEAIQIYFSTQIAILLVHSPIVCTGAGADGVSA